MTSKRLWPLSVVPETGSAPNRLDSKMIASGCFRKPVVLELVEAIVMDGYDAFFVICSVDVHI